MNVWNSGFSGRPASQSKGVLQTKPFNNFPQFAAREFFYFGAVLNAWNTCENMMDASVRKTGLNQ